jgi:hypothetical protein
MKNKNTIFGSLLLGAVILFAYTQSSQAADSSSGCGLGWEVTQKQSLLSSAIRNTTNTFLPNTFSMTSGTSGCQKHSIVKNDEQAVIYAVNNQHSLLMEMAQGKGEFLNGFAQTLGCDSSRYSDFAKLTQSHYSEIVKASSSDGIELYRQVRSQMESSPALKGQCIPRA